MANEITLSFRLQLINGSHKVLINPATLQYSQTNQGVSSGTQTIPVTEVNLRTGDISTNGYLYMRNLDPANFVEWGLDDASVIKAVGTMNPNDFAFIRVKPGVNVRLKADTAPCDVEFYLFED